MAISSWVNNNKATVSIIQYEGLDFIVYTSDVETHRVLLVEEIRSGIKEIPSRDIVIQSAIDMDHLIKETMDKIIKSAY